VTEHDTLTRDWRHDWLLMKALHDAFRRDLDQLLTTTADGAAIRAYVAAGARAIVSAALAPGVTTPAEGDALDEVRRAGVLVVVSSRAGSGRVLPRASLVKRGFVVADNLNPQKARVLTMVALTRTDDPAEVQRMFDEY